MDRGILYYINKNKWFCLQAILCMVLLSGCDNSDKVKDLAQYVKQIKSQKTKEQVFAKLPELIIKSYKYPASDERRDPFIPFVKEISSVKKPNEDRPKQPLEFYSLSSLQMVGVVTINGTSWAIIETPDSLVYRVQEGDYIGDRYGKVEKIEKKKIEIIETITSQGHWQDKYASLTLDEG